MRIDSALLIRDAPLSGWSDQSSINLEGAANTAHRPEVYSEFVGPDFFSTMGIPILLGRGITRTDTAAAPHVAVVDETFARIFFPGQNAIGHRFSFERDPKTSFEIVGLCRPAELTSAQAKLRPRAYLSYAQDTESLGGMFFEVRSQGPPATVVSELRDTVRQVDPSLPLIGVKTQTEQTSDALAFQRLFAMLTTAFGLLALLLAMIGLYGTTSYSVSRKTREMGIRIALGANPADVLRMVIGQGITLALIGVVIGVLAALGATRLIASMIYGVTSYDPLTFASMAAVLVIIALAASYIPARPRSIPSWHCDASR